MTDRLDRVEAQWRKADLEALESRPQRLTEHAFVETILRKCGIENDDEIAAAGQRFAAQRNIFWREAMAPGELAPGAGAALVTASGYPDAFMRVGVLTPDDRGVLRTQEWEFSADPNSDGFSDPIETLDKTSGIRAVKRMCARETDLSSWRAAGEEQGLSAFTASARKETERMTGILARTATLSCQFPSDQAETRAMMMLSHSVRQHEMRATHATTSRFARYLDPDAVKLMRSLAEPDAKTYNWLIGDGDRQAAAYRQQAVRAYPLFGGAMKGSSSVTAAIDGGRSPVDALARKSSVNEPREVATAVKAMGGVTRQMAGRDAYRDPQSFIRSASQIPPEWIPRSRSGFRDFATASEEMATLGDILDRPQRELMAGTRGDWAGARAMFEQNPARGVVDFVKDFHKRVLHPVVYRECQRYGVDLNTIDDQGHHLTSALYGGPHMTEATVGDFDPFEGLNGFEPNPRMKGVMDTMFGARGAKAIMEASRKWHQELPRLDAALQDEKLHGEISWEGLSEPWTAPNGLVVTPLASRDALIDEGRAMEHCVGGYTQQCLRDLHVVSIRSPEGTRLGTAALREPSDPGKPLELDQHQSRKNGEPDKAADKALQAYRAKLESEGIDRDRIAAGRERGRAAFAKLGNLELMAGYNPRDTEWNEQAFKAFQRYMPGAGRKAKSLDAFLLESGIGQEIRESVQEWCEDYRLEQRQGEIERARTRADAERSGPAPVSWPRSEMTTDAFARLSERQQASVNPLRVTPGEGIFRGFNSASTSPQGRAEALEASLTQAAQRREKSGVAGYLSRLMAGPSGKFVREVLVQSQERVIVADTVEEARAVRAVAATVAGATRRPENTVDSLVHGVAPKQPGKPSDLVMRDIERTRKLFDTMASRIRRPPAQAARRESGEGVLS